MTCVAERVGVIVGVEVGVGRATVTVAPETGRPLNWAGCPLLPLAPVTLKV